MAIPPFHALMLPLLRLHVDGASHPRRDLRDQLASVLGLTESDVTERLQSGVSTFQSRTNFAVAYLKQAGALEMVDRGTTRMTPRGA